MEIQYRDGPVGLRQPTSSRQNVEVPKRRDPGPEVPEGAQRALTALSSISRVDTLVFFKDNPDATRRDLVDGTEVAYGTSKFALRELEELGYLVADSPAGSDKATRPVRYTLNRRLLASDLGVLFAHLMG